jgi:hypothetical protein
MKFTGSGNVGNIVDQAFFVHSACEFGTTGFQVIDGITGLYISDSQFVEDGINGVTNYWINCLGCAYGQFHNNLIAYAPVGSNPPSQAMYGLVCGAASSGAACTLNNTHNNTMLGITDPFVYESGSNNNRDFANSCNGSSFTGCVAADSGTSNLHGSSAVTNNNNYWDDSFARAFVGDAANDNELGGWALAASY